jgi:hypothetical protein
VKMKIRERLSVEEARQMDMVDYLSVLGYEPTKIRNNDYWYLSPLRSEKTASFKVNRKLNKWYDHGIGKGGNLIDFGILFYNCTVGEFLQQANSNSSFHQPNYNSSALSEERPESKITILKERPLSSFVLYRYLHERKIPMDIAEAFCKEITYALNGKEYFGIGFKNDAGGFELRNPYCKLSSAPKDITTLHNNAKEVIVFEGFMDFLSFKTINKNQADFEEDYVVLNSASFFEKARSFMEQHEGIRLYLDRDSTGQNYSRYALSLSDKYKDESNLYKHHKDLNEWLMNFGKSPKKSQGQKLH